MDSTLKTKRMVEKGLVLDERGSWVPLVDKLEKERSFIRHLEAGEVLVGKKWITIGEAKAVKVAEPVKKPAEPVKSEKKSEEHISETVTDFEIPANDNAETTDETEVSETSEIPVKDDEFLSLQKSLGVKSKTGQIRKQDIDSLFYDNSDHETVLFRADELPLFDEDAVFTVKKAIARSKGSTSVPIQEDVNELLQSFEEFDEWEKNARKRQAVLLAVMSGVAATVGCAAILFLVFG